MGIRATLNVGALMFVVCAHAPAALADNRALVESVLPGIEARLAPADLTAARDALDRAPGAAPALGMAMLLQGRGAPAAWFYAHDALVRPDAAAALGNLGVALGLAAGAGEAPASDAAWIDAAHDLAAAALALAPDNAVANANLGEAAFRRWRHDPSAGGLDAALQALQRAHALDRDNPLTAAHLAEVLLASGDVDTARTAFNALQVRRSRHPAVIAAALRSPGITAGTGSAPMPQCDAINIVAICKRTCRCTGSITECLNFVACTTEDSAFIAACRAGHPIPTGYDCKADFPKFGIQIPGLTGGLTIIGPGIKVNLGPDGNGGYAWEIKVGNKAFIAVGGSIDPETGAIVGTDIKTGVNITFIPVKGNLGDILNTYGLQPGTVTISPGPDGPANVDAIDDARGFFFQS